MEVSMSSDNGEEILVKEVGGFKIYRIGSGTNTATRITRGIYSVSVRVGQKVTASGRFLVPKGTIGIVTSLTVPGEDGRTSNVVAVWFEGLSKANFMKLEDLELEPY
jgi:hypothetical protein